MYKSEIETSSIESGTNASSSQHPEIETSYMSNDTSRWVKKKKTSTKALVKRLLGVVADLTSKVDHVLQKKDEPDRNIEPDRGFREEEEMINEEEEEKYYHDTHLHYDDIVESPEKANEDIVNKENNDVQNHILLDNLEATSTLSFWRKWNTISSNLNTKHRLHILTLDVEFWLRLLAVTDIGWLICSHIAIWSALLMERRPTNTRLTIFPQELNLQNGKSFFLRNIANRVGDHPKWKDMEMVLFPINVPHIHWFLAVLHLDIWKVHIYDSA
ncbi:unnamed protein product [Lactuca saligna]|uniref:Ubiquitin-like protease family profile domain-containing protein n=1 Tax=Lactuca saligna TaxID=75948 RepID=A0AA35YDR8_LACSI|nr:unnamed protein product [Lactuca saligna]